MCRYFHKQSSIVYLPILTINLKEVNKVSVSLDRGDLIYLPAIELFCTILLSLLTVASLLVLKDGCGPLLICREVKKFSTSSADSNQLGLQNIYG